MDVANTSFELTICFNVIIFLSTALQLGRSGVDSWLYQLLAMRP